MSVTVLQRRADIDAALGRLRARGLQPRRGDGNWAWSLAHLLRTRHRPFRPDPIKSWDVELTIDAVIAAAEASERIVDIGAYHSAILPALARLRYRDLVGVDLNADLLSSPRRDFIQYRRADFHAMPFLADGSCAAVTAISTIEHGWQGSQLLAEVSRVLRPGGIFAASTDYWPEKIETADVRPFGMSWTIFSLEDIRRLLDDAATFGLVPYGEVRLDAGAPVIHWSDRDYTFIHLVLRRA